MLIDQEFDAQPANAAIPQGVSFSAQGAASLEQYLKHADMLMQPLEAQAIKEFLNGMHINHQRSVVKGQLKVRFAASCSTIQYRRRSCET